MNMQEHFWLGCFPEKDRKKGGEYRVKLKKSTGTQYQNHSLFLRNIKVPLHLFNKYINTFNYNGKSKSGSAADQY
jgi:hypothetical protein